ncbi:MAG: TIR domain-containing protein [Elainella sp. Prado103]|jgi:DNA polymerase III delta prime subunit|nr:TIR domain-containing protein [Elainella sp. Prado103]
MTAQESCVVDFDPGTLTNEIFISYSRRDQDFVITLDQTLRQNGYDPWVDWSDIQPAEDWWQAIERGIEAASTFLFVITPDSIASKVCRQEIEYALRHNKRLIPLLRHEGFNIEEVHPSISRHNWIPFRASDDFEQSFAKLTNALKNDLVYVRSHTRLLVRAKEWQRKLADHSFLLRGRDLLEAEHWLKQSRAKQPQPTDLHREFIQASRQDEQARQAVELRLRRMSPQQYRNRQTLLNKVRTYWIQEVLENSLHHQVLVELGLEERRDVVTPPWFIAADHPDPTPKPFPAGTRAITLFDQLGEGRTLLILGEPGIGKTTTLLKLARDLVTRAEQGLDDRIPVVFNLSSWTGGRSIESWLIHELSAKYQIPPAISQDWVETQQLLLLLDGLDEVKAEHQNACVLALNMFQQQHGAEMVVCCRIHDYEILQSRLNFQKAILVRTLTTEQIHHYLESAGAEMAALKTLLERDVVLQELAQSPLMLNLMSLVYQNQPVANLPNLNLDDQRQYLLNSFVEQMLQRRGVDDRYSKEQVIHYLSHLSRQMIQDSRSVFLIEDLQPIWLPTPIMRHIYRVIVMGIMGLLCGIVMGLFAKVLNYGIEPAMGMQVGVIAGAISGIVSGLLPRLSSNWSFGMMTGLASGLIFGLTGRIFHSFQPLNMSIFGLICGLIFLRLNHQDIEPADTIRWSWTKGKQLFVRSMIWGLGVGGTLLITRWLLLPPSSRSRFCSNVLLLSESWVKWTGSVLINFICQETEPMNLTILLGWLALGVYVGFNVCLVLGFKKISKVESRTIPNHGIWKSARNSIMLLGICGSLSAVGGLLFWLMYFLTALPSSNPLLPMTSQFIWWIYYGNHLIDGLMFGLSVGVLIGVLSAMVGGENSGLVILQHVVLRLILWKMGYIPWNYARFLNSATERILLKKVGGSYIFMHRLLLEYFSQLR